jgi:hypothetical protein
MEYLPSGELCTGKVTTVHPTGFGAVCRISTGAIRRVQAAWTVGEAAQLTGSIGATGP